MDATPENIKAARLAAGLNQADAAALVYLGHLARWSEAERGVAPMDPARWELFLVKVGQHPDYAPRRGVKVPRAPKVAA